ncbi:hypothetical protein E5676_scaffold1142G00240 [Cucumis melo var. makuwa]|uniref:Uncharacterized protein n=1 Tax=Cucumis melo var. makuwa TaxID=1194695 RepID=A0A5D3DVR2_CUCMM|nr:hypothetical protein E6C27_scaffold406G00310 [Cucumis melo var. makuwa]TYK27763.1 hypothetical protein E5676_scaffold1142G00240 [Cucumis melo var. makuwa]
MHALKHRVESDTSTVYSISLYESTITTRDEPWFGELKLAPRSSNRTPSYCADHILRNQHLDVRQPLKFELGKNGEVHPNRAMKNKRRTKGQWCTKCIVGMDMDPNKCVEELIWSFLLSPWSQSSVVFPGQIKDFWGFTQLQKSIFLSQIYEYQDG